MVHAPVSPASVVGRGGARVRQRRDDLCRRINRDRRRSSAVRLAAAIWRCTRDSIPTPNPQPDPLTRAERDLRVGMRKARVYRSAQDGRFDSERFEGFVTKEQGRTTYVFRTK